MAMYLRCQSTFDEITNDSDWISSTSQPEQIFDTEVEPEYDGGRPHTDSYAREKDGQSKALVNTDRSVISLTDMDVLFIVESRSTTIHRNIVQVLHRDDGFWLSLLLPKGRVLCGPV